MTEDYDFIRFLFFFSWLNIYHMTVNSINTFEINVKNIQGFYK